MKCLTCGKEIDCGGSRGCCFSCVEKHRRAVRRKLTTWEALIAAGKCLPRKDATTWNP